MDREQLHGLVPVHDQLQSPIKFRGQYLHTNVDSSAFANRLQRVVPTDNDADFRRPSISNRSDNVPEV
jgi:hypothetical protein